MKYVTHSNTFQEMNEEYHHDFSKQYLEKTKAYVKGLRKTLTQQVASDIYETVIEDFQNDMYKYFLKYSRKLWTESLDYILGRNIESNDENTFESFIAGIGYDAQALRKLIYEDNKDELKQAIAFDYLYNVLEDFFHSSDYWMHIDLKFDEPYTQYKIMENFMLMLAEKDNFDSVLFDLISEKTKQKKEELYKLNKEIEMKINKLEEIIDRE